MGPAGYLTFLLFVDLLGKKPGLSRTVSCISFTHTDRKEAASSHRILGGHSWQVLVTGLSLLEEGADFWGERFTWASVSFVTFGMDDLSHIYW